MYLLAVDLTTIDRKSSETEKETQQVVDALTSAFRQHDPSSLTAKREEKSPRDAAGCSGEVNKAFADDAHDVIDDNPSASHVVDIVKSSCAMEASPNAFGQFWVLLRYEDIHVVHVFN